MAAGAIQGENSYTLFPCGCTVDQTHLVQYLRNNRTCQTHRRAIQDYVATDLFKQFLERMMQQRDSHPERGDQLLQTAKRYLQENNLPKATELFLQVLEISPECKEAQEFLQFLSFNQPPKSNQAKRRPPARSPSPPFRRKERTESFNFSEPLSKLNDHNGYSPMHYAAMSGQVDQMRLLDKIDPNSFKACGLNGATPLIVATQNGQLAAVQFLIKQGARFCKIAEGYNVFHCAFHFGHGEIGTLLLDRLVYEPKDLNSCSEEGGTTLMLACELDSLPLVKKLIEKGANPSIERKDGITAIEIAIKRGCKAILEFLVERATITPHASETAAKEGSQETVEILAKKSEFLNFRNGFGDTLLHIATRNGNIPVALFLLGKVALSENKTKETPFTLATAGGFWELIDGVRRQGVTNQELEERLPQLICCGYHPTLGQWIEELKLPRERLNQCLKIACREGHHDLVSLVLIPQFYRNGWKIEGFQEPNGWNILHFLTKSDGIYLFKPLLGDSSDILQRDSSGRTLPYIAAENGSLRVLLFLLGKMEAKGISLHNLGPSCHLFYAVMDSCHEKSIETVLDRYKDQNLATIPLDGQQARAAHLAAQKGSTFLLKILKRYSADFTSEDAQGNSPLYYAVRAEAKEAVEFLITSCEVPISARAIYLAASLQSDTLFNFLERFSRDLDVLDAQGDTALLLSLWESDQLAFERLVRAHASLELRGRNGWTALPLASRQGMDRAVEMLLNLSLRDATFVEGRNALHWACLHGHVGCAELLVKAGFRPNLQSMAPDRKSAVDIGQGKLGISLVLGQRDDGFEKWLKTFLAGVREGNLRAIAESLPHLPPNETILHLHKGKTIWGTPLQLLLRLFNLEGSPLKEAIKEKRLDPNIQDNQGNTLSHLLLRAGLALSDMAQEVSAKVNFSLVNHLGATLFHLAAGHSDTKVIATIDQNQKNRRDKQGWTPIFYAVQSKKIENVVYLIKQGVDLSLWDHQLLTPLLVGCALQNLNLIRALIEGGAPINQRGTIRFISPLYFSLETGNDEVSYTLLFNGARCDLPNRDGIYPIHIAAETGKLHFLRFLAAKELSLEKRDRLGRQPVHFAAIAGTTRVIQTLGEMDHSILDAPVLTEESSDEKEEIGLEGATPLFFAALKGRTGTVEWLLNHRANPESQTRGEMTVLSAAAATSRAMLTILRPYGLTERPEHLMQALLFALFRDNVETAETLYHWGIPLNAAVKSGEMGLHVASRAGAIQCTAFLLEQGAHPLDPNASGESSLELAAANDSVDQFKLLVDYLILQEADFDLDRHFARGETPLHIAAKNGNLQHVAYLIQLAAKFDCVDVGGQTPLHLAAREGHSAVVELLLICGADPSKRSSSTQLAFELVDSKDKKTGKVFAEFVKLCTQSRKGEMLPHLAVRANNPLALHVLSHLGLLDETDNLGHTSLHLAIELGNGELALQLLKLDPDLIDKQNLNQQSALWLACFKIKKANLAKILYKWGANPNLPDNEGMTIREKIASLEDGRLKQELAQVFADKGEKE